MTLVKLNVGGKIFMTFKDTINIKNSFFEKLFDESLPITKDDNGNIFIDRDPKLFNLILNKLRDHQYIYDNDDIKNELNFYGLLDRCKFKKKYDKMIIKIIKTDHRYKHHNNNNNCMSPKQFEKLTKFSDYLQMHGNNNEIKKNKDGYYIETSIAAYYKNVPKDFIDEHRNMSMCSMRKIWSILHKEGFIHISTNNFGSLSKENSDETNNFVATTYISEKLVQ